MERTKIYAIGPRKEKAIPALEREFEVLPAATKPTDSSLPDIEGIRQAGTVFRLIAPILRHRDDIIVIVFSMGKSAIITGEICRRLGVPFLVRIRGGMWGEFRDHAETAGKSRWEAKTIEFFKTSRREIALSRADGILPVSKFTRNQFYAESSVSISPGAVRAVPNPIDVERFDGVPTNQFKRELGIPSEDHLAITITSFHYRKKFNGVRYFMPSIGNVLASHPNWHIAVVGRGAAAECGHREILAATPETVHDRVHLPGYWPSIETALADAEIAFHLSYRDSAAMTVLEAQAAHLPIIVNDAAGMKNFVDESNALSDPSAIISYPEDIVRPFETLIENPSLRAKIGERNRRYVEQNFSPAKISSNFYESIEKIVSY